MADIDLSFPGEVAADVKPNVDGLQTHIVEGIKPEIKHTFRQPEKRPPAIISNAFTVLCLVPILIMIGCWMKVMYYTVDDFLTSEPQLFLSAKYLR